MAQRKASTIDEKGGGTLAAACVPGTAGIQLVLLTDDKGVCSSRLAIHSKSSHNTA